MRRDAFVEAGFPKLGYEYFNLDDCWAKGRAADGTIKADPAVFPSGIESFVRYVHAAGLKFGIYQDRAYRTGQSLPGSFGHEQIDMASFAAWGVDYISWTVVPPSTTAD